MVQNYRDNRILWIDWAKSIGMFLVILGHCHIRESEQIVTQYIYSFHMMLFFFLSGILCRRDLSLTSIKKDIRYLIFPYLVYGFILIAFSTLRSRTFDIVVLLAQIKSLFWGDDISIGPIWFLPALFICKQLFLRWYTRLGMSVVLIASSFVLCGYNGLVSLTSCDIFSSLTYCFCYISILIIDKECPLIFGLKGIRNRQVFHGYVL